MLQPFCYGRAYAIYVIHPVLHVQPTVFWGGVLFDTHYYLSSSTMILGSKLPPPYQYTAGAIPSVLYTLPRCGFLKPMFVSSTILPTCITRISRISENPLAPMLWSWKSPHLFRAVADELNYASPRYSYLSLHN